MSFLASNTFGLQEICRFLGLTDLVNLCCVSSEMKETLYSNENIWGDQYQRDAKNFTLQVQGKPVSWRLLYLVQKGRKTTLTLPDQDGNVIQTLTWDNSLGILKQVIDKYVVTYEGRVFVIEDNATFSPLRLSFLVDKLFIKKAFRHSPFVYLQSREGVIYSALVKMSNQGFWRALRLTPVVSEVKDMVTMNFGNVFLKHNGEVWMQGYCFLGRLGPDRMEENDRLLQVNNYPLELCSFPEKISWISSSMVGMVYGGESGKCYFAGQLHRQKVRPSVKDTLWEPLPPLPSDEKISSVISDANFVWALSLTGRIYMTCLNSQGLFVPFERIPGWSGIVEIRNDPAHCSRLIRTLSGRVYNLDYFGQAVALPFIGVGSLSFATEINYSWLISTDYFHLDRTLAKAIDPLIIHREPYGASYIWVDRYGNRYLYTP